MKRKDLENYKQKTIPELAQELRIFSERAHILKTDIVTGKVKSLKEMYTVKKTIAQLQTLMKEKQL